MCWFVLAVAAFGLAGCRFSADVVTGTQPPGVLAGLAWLTGSWAMADGDSSSEEHWTRPGGGTMLGINRTIVRGKTVAWELVRIESTPAGIVYLASPGGRNPPTPFGLIDSGPMRATFENPDHDFPQRVIYERRGNELQVRIEGLENGQPKSQQWSWRLNSLSAMP
jgi:hypothetical protein